MPLIFISTFYVLYIQDCIEKIQIIYVYSKSALSDFFFFFFLLYSVTSAE